MVFCIPLRLSTKKPGGHSWSFFMNCINQNYNGQSASLEFPPADFPSLLHGQLLDSIVMFVSFLIQKNYFWKFLMNEVSVYDYWDDWCFWQIFTTVIQINHSNHLRLHIRMLISEVIKVPARWWLVYNFSSWTTCILFE